MRSCDARECSTFVLCAVPPSSSLAASRRGAGGRRRSADAYRLQPQPLVQPHADLLRRDRQRTAPRSGRRRGSGTAAARGFGSASRVAALGAGDRSASTALGSRRAGRARYAVGQRDREPRDDRGCGRTSATNLRLGRRGARRAIIAVIAHETRPRARARPREPALRADEHAACGRAAAAPPERWRYRCRTLEADDTAVLIRRFGGRVRSRGLGVLLRRSRRPAAPLDVGHERPTPSAASSCVSWTMPSGSVARVQVPASRRSMPDRRSVIQRRRSSPISPLSAGAAHSRDDVVTAAGSYCYTVFASALARTAECGA